MEYKPTFTLSDIQLEKITDHLGYGEGSRSAFLLDKVKKYLKNCYKAQIAMEIEEANASAMETADDDLKTLTIS